MREWWRCYIWFISWGKYWKGVYVHFLPWYTVRIYAWNIDWRRKRWGAVTRFLIQPPKCDLPGDGD